MRENSQKYLGQLAFCEHQWLAQLDHGDILVKPHQFVAVGVLYLATDSVAHLPVLLSPVVVPGPHSQAGAWSTLGTVSRC